MLPFPSIPSKILIILPIPKTVTKSTTHLSRSTGTSCLPSHPCRPWRKRAPVRPFPRGFRPAWRIRPSHLRCVGPPFWRFGSGACTVQWTFDFRGKWAYTFTQLRFTFGVGQTKSGCTQNYYQSSSDKYRSMTNPVIKAKDNTNLLLHWNEIINDYYAIIDDWDMSNKLSRTVYKHT